MSWTIVALKQNESMKINKEEQKMLQIIKRQNSQNVRFSNINYNQHHESNAMTTISAFIVYLEYIFFYTRV